MKKFILSLILFPIISQALSPEAERIFSKDSRLLNPPPRSLRADRGPAGVSRKRMKDLEITTRPPEVDESQMTEEDSLEEQPVASPYAKKKRKKKRRDDDEDTQGTATHERNFGVGLVGGGAYGIFGAEFDFRLTDQWTAGFGLGTGMSYDTWGLNSRFFFRDATFSPFTQVGYANWYLRRISHTGEKVRPEFLANRFFADKYGNIHERERLHLIYGGIGVLYQGEGGVATSLQVQYFIHLKGFQGGLYGALGVYYYF